MLANDSRRGPKHFPRRLVSPRDQGAASCLRGPKSPKRDGGLHTRQSAEFTRTLFQERKNRENTESPRARPRHIPVAFHGCYKARGLPHSIMASDSTQSACPVKRIRLAAGRPRGIQETLFFTCPAQAHPRGLQPRLRFAGPVHKGSERPEVWAKASLPAELSSPRAADSGNSEHPKRCTYQRWQQTYIEFQAS